MALKVSTAILNLKFTKYFSPSINLSYWKISKGFGMITKISNPGSGFRNMGLLILIINV